MGFNVSENNLKDQVTLVKDECGAVEFKGIPAGGNTAWNLVKESYDKNVKDITYFDASDEEKKAVVESAGEFHKESIIPKKDREARAALRRELAEKYKKTELAKTYMFHTVSEKNDQHFRTTADFRTFNGLLYKDMTGRAYYKNRQLMDIIKNGNEEQKKEAISRRLEEIGQMDLSFVNLDDDAAFVADYEKYAALKDVGDLTNIRKLAENFGIDLTEKRFAAYLEKAPLIYDISDAALDKVRLISSAVYDAVDFEKLPLERIGAIHLENKEMLGNSTVTGMDAPMALNILKKQSLSPFSDPALSKEEKVQKAAKNAAEKSKIYKTILANAPVKAEDGIADEPLNVSFAADGPDVSDGFFEKKLEEFGEAASENANATGWAIAHENMLKGVALYRMRREYEGLPEAISEEEFRRRYNDRTLDLEIEKLRYTPRIAEVTEKITEEDLLGFIRGESAPLEALDNKVSVLEQAQKDRETLKKENPDEYYRQMQEYYTQKITENYNKIEPKLFELSPEEIREMVSPERIDQHDRAVKVVRDAAILKAQAAVYSDGELGSLYARISGHVIDADASEERKQRFYSGLAGVTEEDNEFRKKRVVGVLNRVNRLDPGSVRPTVTLEDKAGESKEEKARRKAEAEKRQRIDYALEEYSTAVIGHDIEKTMGELGNEGFAFSDSGRAKYTEERKKYITALSSDIQRTVSHLADELYFTLPLEKISMENAALLTGVFGNAMSRYLTDLGNEKNFEAIRPTPAQTGVVFTGADIVPAAAGTERSFAVSSDLRRAYKTLYDELKDADHIYNFNNSAEYKNLLTELRRTDELLASINGAVPEDRKQELYDAIVKVGERANAYITAKKGQSRNDIRETRLNICSRILKVNKKLIDPKAKTGDDCRKDSRFMKFMDNDLLMWDKNAYLAGKKAAMKLDAQKKIKAEEAEIPGYAFGTNASKCAKGSLRAKDELLKALDEKTLDKDLAGYLIAEIFCCDMIKAGNKEIVGLSGGRMDDTVNGLMKTDAFREYTKDLNADKVLAFLAADKEDNLQDLKDLMSAEELKNFKKLGVPTPVELLYTQTAKAARDELRKMADAPAEITDEKARKLFTTVIECEISLPKNYRNRDIDRQKMDAKINAMAENEQTKNIFSGITADTIRAFLKEGGARDFNEAFRNNQRPEEYIAEKEQQKAREAMSEDELQAEISGKNRTLVDETARAAREALAEMAKHPAAIDQREAQRLFVKVLVCEVFYAKIETAKEVYTPERIDNRVDSMLAKDAIREATQDITAEKIGAFLAKDGVTALNEEIREKNTEVRKAETSRKGNENIAEAYTDFDNVAVANLMNDIKVKWTDNFEETTDKALAVRVGKRVGTAFVNAVTSNYLPKTEAQMALAKVAVCQKILNSKDDSKGLTREELDAAAQWLSETKGFRAATKDLPLYGYMEALRRGSDFYRTVEKKLSKKEKEQFADIRHKEDPTAVKEEQPAAKEKTDSRQKTAQNDYHPVPDNEVGEPTKTVAEQNTELLNANLQNARKKIEGMIKNPSTIKDDAARELMATVCLAEVSLNNRKSDPQALTQESFEDKVRSYCDLPAMQNITTGIDKKRLQDFLAEGGVKKFNEDFGKAVKAESKGKKSNGYNKEKFNANYEQYSEGKFRAYQDDVPDADFKTLCESIHTLNNKTFSAGTNREMARQIGVQVGSIVAANVYDGVLEQDRAVFDLAEMAVVDLVIRGDKNAKGMTTDSMKEMITAFSNTEAFKNAVKDLGLEQIVRHTAKPAEFYKQVEKEMTQQEKTKFNQFAGLAKNEPVIG